ncbi:tail fiber assembly protein [Enterobacter huaxiensis]|uniref:Tail fiber assembly protein n=1 Tax=Enterobacter huaxiensis TaxID=2494702 RepID=A0A428LVQ2_9ENTR|nr:tail fiber assembly protein [Enterobacter huaxiensis]RSK69414.1 tail fiber assembly protein [Enterobacter huaxiensis]
MKIFNNFTPYVPEGNDLPASVLFLMSDNGVDWYEAQKDFKKDTLKVMFDSAGVICCAEIDVSGLWPIDCSVVEIDGKDVPSDFEAGAGGWIFDGKKITARKFSKEEFLVKAEAQKTHLMNTATAAIAPLQDAAELGIATNVELTALNVWKRYRVLLNRLDISTAPNIAWPDQPTD